MPEKVTVIICHHQGNLVLPAIASVLKSRGVEVELIVATSVQNAAFNRVRTLYLPGMPARKRNVAYRFATSDYITFFDDDVEVEPRAIEEMLKVIKQDRVGMVFGKTLNMEYRNMFDEAGSFLTPFGFLWARGDRTKDIGQFEIVEPILAGKSAACMIRREVYVDTGFFDESYGILGEESDLAWRVWLTGWKVMYVPKSVTYHAFNTRFKPMDFYSNERVYFNGCRNYLAMLTTNLGAKRLAIALPCQVASWLLCGLGMFVAGKWKASFNIFRGLAFYFSRLTVHLRKRQLVQGRRKIGEEELMAIVMRKPKLSYYLKRFFRYISSGLHG